MEQLMLGGEEARLRGTTERRPAEAVPPEIWPDATPIPAQLPKKPDRRPLATVAAEIELKQLSRRAVVLKRAVDIVGSVFALTLLSPLFLLLTLAVRLTSRGPAYFVQTRCGHGGRTFRFYKFRTMVVDAEQRKASLQHLNEMTGPVFKMRRDPRITRLGAVLRKLSLDELPQFWNVLKGDMSLVGPRPPTVDEVERYDARQAQRLSVMPGITGLWQVSGRSDIADFDQWLALDLKYARTWSLWLDFRIMCKTVFVVLNGKGAQ